MKSIMFTILYKKGALKNVELQQLYKMCRSRLYLCCDIWLCIAGKLENDVLLRNK